MPTPSGADSLATTPPASVCAALARCTHDLLLLVDADARLLWCNPAVETLLGRSLAQLAGSLWHKALPTAPAHLRQLRDAAAQLAQTSPGQSVTAIDVELDGTGAQTTWLRISAHALATEGATQAGSTQWLLVMRDISEAKRHEREATRLSELLDMAQEFGRIGVWERAIPSGAGHWDRHVFSFWGLDPAQGTPSYTEALAHIHPEDRARMTYQTTTREPGRYTQRYRVLRTDGSTRWVQSQWEVKKSLAGEPERAIGIMMDDTDVYELARALDDAGAQLKLAIELGNIAIWRHDLSSGRVRYNERAQQALNLPGGTEGLTLRELFSHVHPDDLPRLTGLQASAPDADRPTDIEARIRLADGSYHTVLTRRVLERGSDGAPQAWVGIALDVSEQAQDRHRAHELTRRLETAVAAAGVGVWSYGTESGGRQWNETMFALVGRPLALGPPSRREFEDDIVFPADRERIRSADAALLAGAGGASERQYRVALPSGEIRWLQSRARREVVDGRETVLGITLDITDRRRAEDALRNADERAALAARGAGIGTWELDLVGGDDRWDEQMFRLRGLEPRHLPPSREERLALLHPDDVAGVFDSSTDPAAALRPAQYEFRVRWPDGSFRWLASRSVALSDESGRPLRRIGVNWDVTQARLAEVARRKSAVAQRENLAKSKLLSRVSHELRTPLNAVLGFTQLLQAEAKLPASQRARLGWIRSAAEHLLVLIDDVLDLSRLEVGQVALALQPVRMSDLVRETLPLLEPLAARHGAALEIGPIDGVALADPTRLRQVLINLLSNGIKYSHAPARVSIFASSAAGRVELQVSDSGRGLAPEQVTHLFEPFNRLGAEHSGVDGSGLGLVIVKALVERMGGTVQVTSQLGQGTRFSIELPAAEAPPASLARPPTSSAIPAAALRPGRVLYIEDNPVNMLLVQELVATRPGLEIIPATTGEQGVQRAIELRPELVLVDMQLPDFDGLEVLRRLRASPRTAELRCVALSANALPDDIARALAAGFAEYWTKPIDFDRFLAALDEAFAADLAPAGG